MSAGEDTREDGWVRQVEALEQSRKRLRVVRDLGELATSSPDLDVVLHRVLQGTLEAVRASVGMIFLKVPGKNQLVWGASIGLSDEFVASYRQKSIVIGEGLTGEIAQRGEAIYIRERSSRDPRIARSVVAKENLHSFIGVPLVARDEVIGVMNVLTRPPSALSQEEELLVSAIGAHVGSAILNAQLYKQLKETESKLQSEQVFMDTVVDALSDTLFVYEINTGRATRWNRTFRDVSGYSDEEIAAMKAPAAYFDEKDLIRFEAVLSRVRKHGLASERADFVTKDGRRLPFEFSGALIENPVGTEPLLVALGRDLTERQQVERERLKVQKLESLGIFAGGIAHDFNNLLAAIVGQISLAKLSPKLDGAVYECLSHAETASMQARDLTQQLLTFSRGGAPLRKTIDLSRLIRETVSFALRGTNTAVEFLLPDDLWNADIDKGQICQVFQNLAINASQAMPGGGTLTIVGRNLMYEAGNGLPLGEGEYVVVSVQDTGCGIGHDHIERIFDPYYTTKQQGSGLGLTTCYSVVKRHGGHISVESGVGAGTTFTVYLPATRQRVRTSVAPLSFAPLDKNILVMDDDPNVAATLLAVLKKLGCRVTICRDGDQAVAHYRRALEQGEPFDGAIFDLTIRGGLGGKEAMKSLLEIDENAKVVVSSGYSTDPVMSRYREHGFSARISKPFTVDEMCVVLRGLFEEER